MAISFSRPGMAELSIEPIPGSLTGGGGHKDSSAGAAPPLRLARAVKGSCEALLDSETLTVERVLDLASPCGPGAGSLSGDASCVCALLDVAIDSSSGVLLAKISWTGSEEDAP